MIQDEMRVSSQSVCNKRTALSVLNLALPSPTLNLKDNNYSAHINSSGEKHNEITLCDNRLFVYRR